MAKSKFLKANKKIHEAVVSIYKEIENKSVGKFNKINEKFIDNYLTKEGESIEEAKERLAKQNKERMNY